MKLSLDRPLVLFLGPFIRFAFINEFKPNGMLGYVFIFIATLCQDQKSSGLKLFIGRSFNFIFFGEDALKFFLNVLGYYSCIILQRQYFLVHFWPLGILKYLFLVSLYLFLEVFKFFSSLDQSRTQMHWCLTCLKTKFLFRYLELLAYLEPPQILGSELQVYLQTGLEKKQLSSQLSFMNQLILSIHQLYINLIMCDANFIDSQLNFTRLLQMFQIEREDIDYEVTLTSFKDQAHNKNMLIDQFTYHLTNICKSNFKSDKVIVQIAKFSRKFIQEIGKIIQQLHGYLIQLKLDFLHQLIFKIFKVLIIAFNKLSQKFVITLNDLKKNHDKFINDPQTQPTEPKSSKDHHKEIQYFDFIIRNLEEQQTKLEERKKIMEKEIFAQNISFSSITASDAVNQLEELNKNLQKIIINSQKVSGQNVLYRYQQLSKYILSLRKPEQLKDQFCNNIAANTKDKFLLAMERLMKQFFDRIKQKQRQTVFQQIQRAKPKLDSRSMQTQPDFKIKQIQLLNRQKKALGMQLESYKRQIACYEKEVQRWKQRVKQEKEVSTNLQKKIDAADESIKKKINDMLKMRTQYESSLSKKNQTIESLTKKNQQIESFINENQDYLQQNKPNTVKPEQIKQQASFQAASTNSTTLRRKTIIRNRLSMPYQHQNELKQKRKQNIQLRKCLQKLLQKFGQISNTKQNAINEFMSNLKNGNTIYAEKINEFLSFIQEQIQQNQISKTLDQLKNVDINDTKQQKQQKIQIKYKLNNTGMKSIKPIQKGRLNDRVNYSMMPQVGRNSKLQKLKREFIQKISMKKKSNDPRLKKNYFTNQTYDSTIDANYDASNFSIDGDMIQQANYNKNQNSKLMFSHKDITFQQFKICKIDKIDKKPSKIRKKHNTVQNQHIGKQKQKQNENKLRKNVLIGNIQCFEVAAETKQILQNIDSKNDSKDFFIKQFIQTMLKQYRQKKGLKFIQQVIRSEIALLNNKNIKKQMKNVQSQQMMQFIVKPLR